jgi:protein involved in polysaccharide export with SLBB domain
MAQPKNQIAVHRWNLNKNIDCAVEDAPHNRGAKEMKSRFSIYQLFVACLSAVVLGFQVGCATLDGGTGTATAGAPAEQPLVHSASTSTIFRPGDVLEVDFADTQGLPSKWQQTIREDGTITLPLSKTVNAAGLRKGELEQAIHDVYVPTILRRLTVNVRSDKRSYFVSGEVKVPGEKDHTGHITTMRAIATAGDFTDFASKTKIDVIRVTGEKIRVNGKKAMEDASKDIPVYPGDRVHVHRRIF